VHTLINFRLFPERGWLFSALHIKTVFMNGNDWGVQVNASVNK